MAIESTISNEMLTLGIAAYAAIISTFVLGWDAYKWLASGAKIDLTISHGMQLFGGSVEDKNRYISLTANNVGDRPTTITNMGGMYFDSWWRAYVTRRKPKQAFVVTEPSQAQRIPYRFDIGGQWIGMVEQTEETIKHAKNGYLFLILYTSDGGRGRRIRLKVKDG